MPRTLVSVAQLAEELGAPAPPSLLDVRWELNGPPGRDGWLAGHIPGAAFVDLERELAAAPGAGGRHPLPEPAAFAAAMRRAGVRGGEPVVVYDAGDATSAARCRWLLRHHGHDDVRILDGGYRAWSAAGLPVEVGETPSVDIGAGDFEAGTGRLATVDAEGAGRLAREGILLDARAGERYRGEVEPVDPIAGHIPGAVSAPTRDNLDGAGRFLPAATLAQRFAALGVTPGREVGVYCGSGVTAIHELLALELAGIEGTLYPGSWSEWVAGPARPVAVGAEPMGTLPPASDAPGADTTASPGGAGSQGG